MVSVSPLVAATLFMVQVTSSVAFISPGPRCSRCSTSGRVHASSPSSLGKPVLLSSSRAARSRIRRLLSSLDNAGDRRHVLVGSSRQFQLEASSSNDNGIQPDDKPKAKKATTTTTTDLKELASRIDKNNSQPSREEYTGIGEQTKRKPSSRPRYQLGVGKNLPLSGLEGEQPVWEQQRSESEAANNWVVREVVNNLVVPGGEAAALKKKEKPKKQTYDMGLGKNSPLNTVNQSSDEDDEDSNKGDVDEDEDDQRRSMRTTIRLLPNADELSARLTKAVWDEKHFDDSDGGSSSSNIVAQQSTPNTSGSGSISLSNIDSTASVEDNNPSTQQQHRQQPPEEETITDYQQIDLSVPPSVYSLGSTTTTTTNTPIPSQQPPIDLVWDLMRREAQTEAAREPLLVSFLYSTILNHATLESALSFHLANRLSSPAMLSTQIMSLIREALDADPSFRRNLRADMLAVRDRDPACNCLPDVFLYFKGFHALQTYRVAHYLWRSGRRVLAHYLQSQVSQHFQIDIHPNATLGSGIMLDHGTGIVIGETAHLGHNCSVLHHVTLGGSGKKGNDRHPKVGNGVLLGAGASVLGNINIGDGCQVGAGTLVIEDLPPRTVAVGVPAKIIGRFVDVTAQPSTKMNQLGSKESEEDIIYMDGI